MKISSLVVFSLLFICSGIGWAELPPGTDGVNKQPSAKQIPSTKTNPRALPGLEWKPKGKAFPGEDWKPKTDMQRAPQRQPNTGTPGGR
ncbi:MAG: hypothetical protein HY537_12480 [Deltaproteobacteria bacterium]|nr:hypothetical protein [Deltaproteobacteria bacterium]